MSLSRLSSRALVGITASSFALMLSVLAEGQDSRQSRENLREPVYRVSKALEPSNQRRHPLDQALKVAADGLKVVRNDVRDYSCVLVKRERVNGVLNDREYIYTEIRNRQVVNNRIVAPFSVYMRFLKPDKVRGREVIFVEGRNNNKLVAHEAANFLKVMPPVWLKPDGRIAMRGNLYPITDVGLENLIVKLIERGERDRRFDECDVQFIEGAAINGRTCTVLVVKHPVRRPHFDFHIARIFIDDELNLPVRYAAYDWPATPGGRPQLLEEYTYTDIKVNVGLTDRDFDHTKKFKMGG